MLDIASASGSFPAAGLPCSVIAIDEDPFACRTETVPGPSKPVDLAICNHGFEHFVRLEEALDEIARVLKPDGRLYISVPDGYGLCDNLYRWAFEGGGHVNRFRRDELVRLVELRTGLRLERWQKLYSSFGYLLEIPKLQPTGAPDFPFWFSRGKNDAAETPAYFNVCRHCGAGHPADHKGRLGLRRWACATCGGRNPFWFK